MRNRAHLAIGLLTLLGFICTGVYLRLHIAQLVEGPEAVRIAFRSNHIYILMSSLINLLLGVYAGPFQPRKPARLIGSILVLAAPFVLAAAFLTEPAKGRFERPLTSAGVIVLAAGVIVHSISAGRRRAAADAPATPR